MNNPINDQDGTPRDRLGEEWRDKIIGLDDEPADPDAPDYDPAEEEQRLAFADEEERLPWLESDEDYEDDSVDTSRVVIIAILGLLAILGAVGLAWWLSRPAPDAALVADGSTIEAPEGPIRTAPDGAGAADAEGTGDLSFAAAEGLDPEEVDGTPAGAGAANAAPSIDRDQPANAGNGAAAPSASADGVGVQVAAYSSRAAAQAGWNQLSSRYDSLSGLQNRIVAAEVNGATVYRLQAVAGTLEAAESLCRSLRAAGAECQVKR